MSKSKKVLFVMTGSIAAYKACHVISRLVQSGHEVQVVATQACLQFIGEATLEGLSSRKVATDLWTAGRAMDHISLVRWADVIIVAPATANYINSIASGLGSDLAMTLFLAHDFTKPFLLAPAMNTKMYLHPATQKSLGALKDMGVKILETASGVLACGEVGWGKLLEPQLLLQEIESVMDLPANAAPVNTIAKEQKPLRVLITSGGTIEPIDQVRVITNKSTGATGACLADAFIELGAEVHFLHARDSIKPRLGCDQSPFVAFQDAAVLFEKLLRENSFDLVVHAAAISDYSVVNSSEGKLSSDSETMTLQLKRNPKLLNSVKTWSKNGSVKLIAFKMTAAESVEVHRHAVEKVLRNAGADLVIHNDMSEMNWQSGHHIYHAYSKEMKTHELKNKSELAAYVTDWALHQGELL